MKLITVRFLKLREQEPDINAEIGIYSTRDRKGVAITGHEAPVKLTARYMEFAKGRVEHISAPVASVGQAGSQRDGVLIVETVHAGEFRPPHIESFTFVFHQSGGRDIVNARDFY